MSNPSKGARLWLKPATATRKAMWIIRDGEHQRGTGCSAENRAEAERRLGWYLGAKHTPTRASHTDPSSIKIADVVNIYTADRGAQIARPDQLASRLRFLLGLLGDKTLADITPAACRDYVARRGSVQAAKRELEDLRAAIRHHWKAGYCDRETRVTLPAKSLPRERWLTRDEAAKLLRAAWREPQRHHVARFILVGLYTGTRAAAICSASFQPVGGRGLVDVDRGVFYRLPQGKQQTKKRQPTIRLPPRLLAHMRRWRAMGAQSVVEYEGRPVDDVSRAFTRAARAAGLGGVMQHTLRHTAITWAMQNGAGMYEAAGYFGVSARIIEQTYGHHHPDYQESVGAAVTARPSQVRPRLAGTNGVDNRRSAQTQSIISDT
jgi:integrase